MAKRISDLIVERLIDWGVDTIFGLPGDGVDVFFEALRTHQEKLRFIQVRHAWVPLRNFIDPAIFTMLTAHSVGTIFGNIKTVFNLDLQFAPGCT